MRKPVAPCPTPSSVNGRPRGSIDVLLIEHLRLPRGPLGAVGSAAGRLLLRHAASALCHVDVSHVPTIDEQRRWYWPGLGLFGSVSHVARWSVTALSDADLVGVDLQDHREREGALAYVGRLIGKSDPATILEYAECESLVKASPLTRETFSGVRLPGWRSEWRPVHPDHWLHSLLIPEVGALAIAAPLPAPIRWWRAVSPTVAALSPPVRVRSFVEEITSCAT